ncbi:MAG: phosphoglycerate kinase, partial [candidate division WOR-3 bacterium]
RYSLAPVAARLRELLPFPVNLANDCKGQEVRSLINAVEPGTVVLLENLRFHVGEEKNDPEFCRELARLADHYVNDAFGTAHRTHASVAGLPLLFDQPAAGLLMEREIGFLSRVTHSPARPFVVIIGGAKVSDKTRVITNLLPLCDRLLVGGGAAFTLLKALGFDVGKSLCEENLLSVVTAFVNNPKLILPQDCIVALSPDAKQRPRSVPVDSIPPDEMGLDIGPATVRQFIRALADAKTVVWAGPLGMFEKEPFSSGTVEVGRALAEATRRGALTIVGGGDTVAAISQFGLTGSITHVSTGGSASLAFLEGKTLPGVAPLLKK